MSFLKAFFLLLVTFIMFGLETYVLWIILSAIAKGLGNKEKVTLPGKKAYYVLVNMAFSFINISAFYFLGMMYIDALKIVYWPMTALISSFVIGSLTALLLTFPAFEW